MIHKCPVTFYTCTVTI